MLKAIRHTSISVDDYRREHTASQFFDSYTGRLSCSLKADLPCFIMAVPLYAADAIEYGILCVYCVYVWLFYIATGVYSKAVFAKATEEEEKELHLGTCSPCPEDCSFPLLIRHAQREISSGICQRNGKTSPMSS